MGVIIAIALQAQARMARGDLTMATWGCTRSRMEGTPPDDGDAAESVVAAPGGDSKPSRGGADDRTGRRLVGAMRFCWPLPRVAEMTLWSRGARRSQKWQ